MGGGAMGGGNCSRRFMYSSLSSLKSILIFLSKNSDIVKFHLSAALQTNQQNCLSVRQPVITVRTLNNAYQSPEHFLPSHYL